MLTTHSLHSHSPLAHLGVQRDVYGVAGGVEQADLLSDVVHEFLHGGGGVDLAQSPVAVHEGHGHQQRLVVLARLQTHRHDPP